VGLIWLLPIDCEDIPLVPDPEEDLVLVASGDVPLDLDPLECR